MKNIAIMVSVLIIFLLAAALYLLLNNGSYADYTPNILKVDARDHGISIQPMNWEKIDVYTRGDYFISGKKIVVNFYKKNRFVTRFADEYLHTNQTLGFEKIDISLPFGSYEIYYKNRDGSFTFIQNIEIK